MLDLDIAGKLFPDPLTMLVQLCATGILFWGFKKLLWKPMQDYLAKRAEVADRALREAHEANSVAFENQKKSDQLLSEAANEAKQIIESGKLEGKRLKEQLLLLMNILIYTIWKAVQHLLIQVILFMPL